MLERTGYENDPYIHTPNGRFYMARPTWHINSIAHALAQNARYNGNAREFYSVAEHSVLVSLLMEQLNLGDPMEGLLHDATESVMSDVPSPWKHLLPDWRKVEYELDTSLRKHFKLAPAMTPGAKQADWLALFIEADNLLEENGADFVDPMGYRPYAMRLAKQGWYINCFPWKRAKDVFLRRYSDLGGRR